MIWPSLVRWTNMAIDHQPIWLLLITSLGFFTLVRKSISTFIWFFVNFIRPSKNLREAYGSWAMITGATDGIGKAFAGQLAEKGLNLILLGRNCEKLETVSKEIRSNFPDVKIWSIVLDFSGEISGGIKAVEKAVEGLDVGVLINNVGVTYPAARYFHEVDEKVWMNIVRVNLEGTTRVTKAVIPGMIRRRKGAIVSIGSGASSVMPSHPLYTIYAATKAYIDQLSRCLNVEYKPCGIDVQCQVPLYVATKMASNAAFIEKTSLFVPSADDYARAAVRKIGYEHTCTSYWPHSIQWLFASWLPDQILDTWRLAIGVRRRAFR